MRTESRLVGAKYLKSLEKRRVDRTMAGLFTIPAIAALGLAIPVWLEDGQNPMVDAGGMREGRWAPLWKVRTMIPGAQELESKITGGRPLLEVKSDCDSRVTKTGRVIRKTTLDELPQVFAVWAGKCHFVGPRVPAITEWEWIIKHGNTGVYREYLEKVRDGLGFGAVGMYMAINRGMQDFEQRLELDVLYWEKASAAADWRILGAAMLGIIKSRGK